MQYKIYNNSPCSIIYNNGGTYNTTHINTTYNTRIYKGDTYNTTI